MPLEAFARDLRSRGAAGNERVPNWLAHPLRQISGRTGRVALCCVMVRFWLRGVEAAGKSLRGQSPQEIHRSGWLSRGKQIQPGRKGTGKQEDRLVIERETKRSRRATGRHGGRRIMS